MRKATPLIFLLLPLFFLFSAQAQQGIPWTEQAAVENHSSLLVNERSRSFSLDKQALRSTLALTALRKNSSAKIPAGKTLYFPSPDGGFEAYRVVQTEVLSEALAARYPDIRSYTGIAVANSLRRIHFTIDKMGFHGMILQKGSTWYLNPVAPGEDKILLASKSQLNPASHQCQVEEKVTASARQEAQTALRSADDGGLRTFRLALACTGEYANFHINAANAGGASDQEKTAIVLSAMNTTMARVNGVFENELALTMELVADNDKVIFLDPATDGLTNNDGQSLLNEIQPIINNAIGIGNYDIGHVFSTGGGGIAVVASPCTDNKAKGVTGLSQPVGDAFNIDFVAHEMGHQYGATHTFNNSCSGNRTDITAVEPGSGSTIMAYAGICPPDIVGQSDDYFHAISIEQIWNNLTNGSGTCAQVTAIPNSPPQLSPLQNYTIPAGTPFVLEAVATDADNDVLTYTWEQQDNEITTQPPLAGATEGPVFRSRPPSTSPNRFFPAPADLVANQLAPTWEPLPTASREIAMSLLVRDNNPAGGQSARDDLILTVSDTGQPFSVSSHSTSGILEASAVETITWQVAGTDQAPVNTTLVNIYILVDDDLDNPVLLLENTPNDGSQEIVVPSDIVTTNARIMVRAVDNIFFALNQAPLEIRQSGFALDLPSLEYSICQPDDLEIPFTYLTYAGFNETTTFSATDITGGISVAFSSTTATADDTPVTITVSDTQNNTDGNASFTLTASASGGEVKEFPITLKVYNSTFDPVNLVSPASGTTNVLLNTTLQWQEVNNTLNYLVEIATDAGFTQIVESALITQAEYLPQNLEPQTVYYWRVRPENECAQGAFSTVSNFSTTAINVNTYVNMDSVDIPFTGTPTVTSTVLVTDEGDLNNLRVGVNISHTYVQDLIISLTSPNGRRVTLISQPCGEQDDINAIFDDSGEAPICGNEPAISGVILPADKLDSFKGEPILGLWTLTVEDKFDQDGGSINSFSLEVSVNGIFQPDEDGDGVFDVDDQCPNTPPGSSVDITGCPIFSLPASNYLIQTTSETCRNNNDGSISIATTEKLNYTVTLSGTGVNEIANFTETLNFNDLIAGSYILCFRVEGEPDYEQCFTINIDEPEDLSVLSRIDRENKVITLDLSGAERYLVTLNGDTFETRESSIRLDLKDGINAITVSTTKACQGSYKEEFVIGEVFNLYPNPVINEASLLTPLPNSRVQVSVFSVVGKQVWQRAYRTDALGRANLMLSELSPGIYLLKVHGENEERTFKLIKQ